MIASLKWAGKNSVTFGDGKMVLLDIEFYSKGNYHIGPIADSTIDSYLNYNADYLSEFDIFAKIEHKEFVVFAGDGSAEGNGVIYVLDKMNNSLIWFAFFENSEPFVELKVDDRGVVNAKSEVNIIWKLPIDNPLNIELVYPS